MMKAAGEVAVQFSELIREYPTGNPLTCGCDLAWIVTNPDHLKKVTINDPTCQNGTLLSDLNPQVYNDNCFS